MAQSRRGAGVYNFKGPDGEVARAHPALTHALNNGGMRVAVVNETSQHHDAGHGITLYKGDVVEVSPKSSCALSGRVAKRVARVAALLPNRAISV